MAATIQRMTLPEPGGRRVPVLTVRSAQVGPTAVITANLHGDECTGVGVVGALVRQLPDLLIRGTVHLYPTLNPEGLEQGCRHLPGDGNDLNRSFPGDPRGGPSERHADTIWQDLVGRRPDLVVDLHTDAACAIPYAILDRVVNGDPKLELRCRELARASGLSVLMEYPRRRYLQYDLDKSLPGALVNGPGIPAVTLEVGPRRSLDPTAVALATSATLGVLTTAGLTDRPAVDHPTRLEGGPWRRESGPRASFTGVLMPLCSPGTLLEPRQPIAEICSTDAKVLETLRVPGISVVVALPERTHVTPGTSCATLAVPDD